PLSPLFPYTTLFRSYVIVDPLRVPRETMAAIFEAWRDGYTDASAEVSRFTREECRAYFDAMIANVRDPNGYAVWMVPVVAARVRSEEHTSELQSLAY